MVFEKIIVIFLFCMVYTLEGWHNKYCELSCDFLVKNFSHTVCDRGKEKCGPHPDCGPDFKVMKLNDSHRQYVVDLHNYLRNKVAMGNETRNNQPSAANMKIMTYSRELEFIAQCWANTCHGSPLVHDVCRRTSQYPHVGQNLGFVNSSVPNFLNLHKSLKELILLWYDEVAIFKNDWVLDTKDRGPKYKVGHYTQMLWANTSEIGCATTYYTTPSSVANVKKWHHVVLVCNYGPGGNYLGLPIYEVGKPCTKCPDGMRPNKHYRGLCGNSKRVLQSKKFNIFEA